MSKEPQYVQQMDEYGNEETIDSSVFSELKACSSGSCTNHRWTKPQDAKQVTLCKPCARRNRLNMRAARAKLYRKRDKKDISE